MSQKDAKQIVDAAFDVISETLQRGEQVTLTGFGTFTVRQRQERASIHPQTRNRIQVPAMKVPGFSAGSTLKDAIRTADLTSWELEERDTAAWTAGVFTGEDDAWTASSAPEDEKGGAGGGLGGNPGGGGPQPSPTGSGSGGDVGGGGAQPSPSVGGQTSSLMDAASSGLAGDHGGGGAQPYLSDTHSEV
jgi:DNA-binding protein HU-beta